MPDCKTCQARFHYYDDLRRHITLTPRCKNTAGEAFHKIRAAIRRETKLRKETRAQNQNSATPTPQEPETPVVSLDNVSPQPSAPPSPCNGNETSLDDRMDTSEAPVVGPHNLVEDTDAVPPEDNRTVSEPLEPRPSNKIPFPSAWGAGQSFGTGKTAFEKIRDEEILTHAQVYGPFRDEAEWELAKWLIKNVGHTQADTFLKLPIITTRTQPSYKNKDEFLENIDGLPEGVHWQCHELEITGDVADKERDPSGRTMRKEKLDLWFRDPVEVVEELIGNPVFRDVMKYAPEEVYEDERKEIRVVNEMWTARWWWELQRRLPKGVTIAPIILSSDKTLLSNFRGDNTAWPVYLTIGNIGKETRRTVSEHATILVGYLPVPKFDCFTEKTRSLAKYRLFHDCMTRIVETLAVAGKEGKMMVCADSLIRNVFPILAAYVANYPEQCLIACCKENRCPICLIDPNLRGSHLCECKRDVQETLFYLDRKQAGWKDTAFKANGLRAVDQPFWRILPHSDIFTSFTPDLLHQLHKGVFKDHLVQWCMNILSKEELDARFRECPTHDGLRHFKNGISHVSQWTGTEHKEMERVFLGLVASHRDPRFVVAVRSLIDFINLSSLQSHTSRTLAALRRTLDDFHANKQVFIDLGGRHSSHFNIPKIHAIEHYEDLIWLFGTADGFNTESPERLHIDYAKNAYRASNRKQGGLGINKTDIMSNFFL